MGCCDGIILWMCALRAFSLSHPLEDHSNSHQLVFTRSILGYDLWPGAMRCGRPAERETQSLCVCLDRAKNKDRFSSRQHWARIRQHVGAAVVVVFVVGGDGGARSVITWSPIGIGLIALWPRRDLWGLWGNVNVIIYFYHPARSPLLTVVRSIGSEVEIPQSWEFWDGLVAGGLRCVYVCKMEIEIYFRISTTNRNCSFCSSWRKLIYWLAKSLPFISHRHHHFGMTPSARWITCQWVAGWWTLE